MHTIGSPGAGSLQVPLYPRERGVPSPLAVIGCRISWFSSTPAGSVSVTVMFLRFGVRRTAEIAHRDEQKAVTFEWQVGRRRTGFDSPLGSESAGQRRRGHGERDEQNEQHAQGGGHHQRLGTGAGRSAGRSSSPPRARCACGLLRVQGVAFVGRRFTRLALAARVLLACLQCAREQQRVVLGPRTAFRTRRACSCPLSCMPSAPFPAAGPRSAWGAVWSRSFRRASAILGAPLPGPAALLAGAW